MPFGADRGKRPGSLALVKIIFPDYSSKPLSPMVHIPESLALWETAAGRPRV